MLQMDDFCLFKVKVYTNPAEQDSCKHLIIGLFSGCIHWSLLFAATHIGNHPNAGVNNKPGSRIVGINMPV